MSDDLVQRVARLYKDKWGVVDHQLARAAIAMCMEEAAKVCDAIEDRLTDQWKANYKVCDFTQGASDGANDCAAAIRALVKDLSSD